MKVLIVKLENIQLIYEVVLTLNLSNILLKIMKSLFFINYIKKNIKERIK